MGFFSGLGGAIGSVGSFLSDNAGPIIGGLTAIGGALITSNANSQAADQYADAQRDASREMARMSERERAELAAAKQRGIRSIQAGTGDLIGTVSPMMSTDYGPIGLTRAQEIGLEDLTRTGNAAIAASGLRGAGRAGPLAVMDARGRYIADALDRNQERGDRARYTVADAQQSQGTQIANTELGVGTQTAQSLAGQGRFAANTMIGAGQAQADATAANAGIYSSALGELGAVIADVTKAQRLDKYGQTPTRAV